MTDLDDVFAPARVPRKEREDAEFRARTEALASGAATPPRGVPRETHEAVILTHGLEFVVAESRSRSAENAARGKAVLSLAEVERLAGHEGQMDRESVSALHAVKLAFPGCAVVSARSLR